MFRALFRISLLRKKAKLAVYFLDISKMCEHQVWSDKTPMRQFPVLDSETLNMIEMENTSVRKLAKMDVAAIGIYF